MHFESPTLEQHLAEIQTAKARILKRACLLRLGEWLGVAVLIGYATSLYVLYQHFADALQTLPVVVFWSVAAVAGTIALAPLAITLLCEHYYENSKMRVEIANARLDVVAAVHTAVREFFGTALPAYSKHLRNFGLAEELCQISSNMSGRFDRTYQTVQHALEQLNRFEGFTGIKHETLKAAFLDEFLKQVLETMTTSTELQDAADVDCVLQDTVAQFEQRLMAAE